MLDQSMQTLTIDVEKKLTLMSKYIKNGQIEHAFAVVNGEA